MQLKAIKHKQGTLFVDEKADIKEGDWFYHIIGDKPKKAIHCYGRNTHPYPKVIAQHNLSIPDVPYVELEEDVRKLAEQQVEILHWGEFDNGLSEHCAIRDSFIAGYKAAQANRWTDEDMEKMFEAGRNYQLSATPTFKEMLNSLKPQIDTIEIEVNQWMNIVLYPKELNGKMETFLKVKHINYK